MRYYSQKYSYHNDTFITNQSLGYILSVINRKFLNIFVVFGIKYTYAYIYIFMYTSTEIYRHTVLLLLTVLFSSRLPLLKFVKILVSFKIV